MKIQKKPCSPFCRKRRRHLRLGDSARVHRLGSGGTVCDKGHAKGHTKGKLQVVFAVSGIARYDLHNFILHRSILNNRISPRRQSRRGQLNLNKLCSLFCRNKPKRKPYRWLLQSYLMAHRSNCLVLLYPYPDTVRSLRLHKTLISTLLIRRSLPFAPSRKTVGPAIADCRFRSPQTTRPAQYSHFSRNIFNLQVF